LVRVGNEDHLFPRLRILQADAAREARFPVRAVPLRATDGKLLVVQPKKLVEIIAPKGGNLKHARSPLDR
jgi:hypothetical protein